MRLRVVHDKTGRILAAAELDVEELTILPQPARPEHKAIDVEVPDEHRKGDLAEICQRLRVDPRRRQLVPYGAARSKPERASPKKRKRKAAS
jgi:hypothetical protein